MKLLGSIARHDTDDVPSKTETKLGDTDDAQLGKTGTLLKLQGFDIPDTDDANTRTKLRDTGNVQTNMNATPMSRSKPRPKRLKRLGSISALLNVMKN